MATGCVEVLVAASPDATWTVVGDFGSVKHWVPDIESFRLQGDDRIFTMFGIEVRERFLSRDEEARSITYWVVSGGPIESHRASITVEPDGNGSKVTWVYSVTPDEMAPILRDTYERALASLHDTLGRPPGAGR